MSLVSTPARTSGDLGVALSDTRAPASNELSAVHVEKIKDHLIEIAGAMNALRLPAKPVRAAATERISPLSAIVNGYALDGVTLATGDRVFLGYQYLAEVDTGADNGIYVVQASAAPIRATDWDDADDGAGGAVVSVIEGTANAGALFVCTTSAPTPGTTPTTWSTISPAAVLQAYADASATAAAQLPANIAAALAALVGNIAIGGAGIASLTLGNGGIGIFLGGSVDAQGYGISGLPEPGSDTGAATVKFVARPPYRDVALGGTDTLAYTDFGRVVRYAKNGAVAITLPDLSANVTVGRSHSIRLVFADAGTNPTITPTGAGVLLNESASAYAPGAAAGTVVLTTFDGLRWYK